MRKIFALLFLILLLCFALYNKNGHTDNIIDVPVVAQMPELPTGCEATAAAMLLQWAGADVTKIDVANMLVKGPVPEMIDGKLYGPNPMDVFVGDPFSKKGYGVFHKAIADVINYYFDNKAYDATGITFSELTKILDSGRPVIVWATIGMVKPKISKSWYDGNGDLVDWKTPEHALLLVGYDKKHVILNDPYSGMVKYYSKSNFEQIWTAMGRQAVTVRMK